MVVSVVRCHLSEAMTTEPPKSGRNWMTRTRPYGEIARVDDRKAPGTENVVLEFHGAKMTFIANTGLVRRAREAITLLHQQGCPLSERAQALLLPSGP